MASIKKRPDGQWRARYRDPDTGKERAKHFETRAAAERWLDTVRGDLVRGEWLDPDAGRIMFKSWATRWLDTVRPTLKPSTVASYESLLRRVNGRFGKMPLSAIRPSAVQEWLGQLTAEGLGASWVRKCAVVLKMVMDAAVRDGLVRTNPVGGVKQPRIDRHEAAYFDAATVERIADAMPTDEYALLIRVLGVGGLRFGEAAALRTEHVDLVRKRLLVQEGLTEVSGRLVRTPTKSYQHRQVPLPPSVARALEELLDSREPGPVFRGPKGGELRYRAFYGRVWRPALERLGLPAAGLHALRHSAAARMIGADASPKAVQTVLGHRSAAFTLTVYGHLFDTDLDDLAARLDAPADSSRTEPVDLAERRARHDR